jgi:putative salt-induced outer membrane protein YdiY
MCLLFTNLCNAQIVNIENQRLAVKKEGWSGSVDLWFSVVKNTNVVFQLGNHNRLRWTRERNSFMFLTDLAMVKANSADLVNSGFEHIRFSRSTKKYPWLNWETFEQAQYNRIQLIDIRMLLGTGYRAIVLDRDSARLNIGAFLMGEYEEQSDAVLNQTVRYSTFVSFDFQFNKHAGVNCITYYQPDFLNPADFRLTLETSIRLKVTQKLSFGLVYNLFYDSRPPTSIPTTTYFLRNSLRYSF